MWKFIRTGGQRTHSTLLTPRFFIIRRFKGLKGGNELDELRSPSRGLKRRRRGSAQRVQMGVNRHPGNPALRSGTLQMTRAEQDEQHLDNTCPS